MSKPLWFLQAMTDRHDRGIEQRLHYALQELGQDVEHAPYRPFGAMDYSFLPRERPVIFLGGLAVVRDYQRRDNHCRPFAWCDWRRLACNYYYHSYPPESLLQRERRFYLFEDLPDVQEDLYRLLGRHDCLFIRPDENDKSFVGQLVERERFTAWYCQANDGTNPLCVVAQPRTLLAEYRLFLADERVVAGSRYKLAGYFETSPDYPPAAVEFAESCARHWSPHPVFVMDVAETPEGWAIVEIGPANCAGFYEAQLSPVLTAMREIACREWEEDHEHAAA